MRIYWLLAVMMIATSLHAGQDRVEDFKQWCRTGMAAFADTGQVSCGYVTKEELRTGSSGFVEAHIPLTETEIQEWKVVQKSMAATFELEEKVERRMIKAHGLTMVKSPIAGWVKAGACGEGFFIRGDESFIAVSVPDNPDYTGFELPATERCKAVRAEWRKKALYRADGSLAEKK